MTAGKILFPRNRSVAAAGQQPQLHQYESCASCPCSPLRGLRIRRRTSWMTRCRRRARRLRRRQRGHRRLAAGHVRRRLGRGRLAGAELSSGASAGDAGLADRAEGFVRVEFIATGNVSVRCSESALDRSRRASGRWFGARAPRARAPRADRSIDGDLRRALCDNANGWQFGVEGR